MYKISANTLFIGQQLVFVPECHSTNSLASDLALQGMLSDGAVIIASSQTAGRGQRGNSWETEPGMNLTFSILLKPTFLSLRKQFYLTMVTSLAVTDLLQEQSVAGVKIKWPNDILVGKRKICGILIENSVQRDAIQQSIVGIGLNVNQQNFSTPKATSLSIVVNKNFDLNKALNALLEKFEKRYLQVRGGKLSELKSEYLDNLFGLGESRTFTSGEKEFTGTVNDVNENGELVVDIHGGRRSYNLKEISFVI